jgi:hypothetical protein
MSRIRYSPDASDSAFFPGAGQNEHPDRRIRIDLCEGLPQYGKIDRLEPIVLARTV